MTDFRIVDGVKIPLTEDEIKQDAELEALEAAKPAPLTTRLDALFKQLPVEAQALFYVEKAAIKLALEEGNTEAALVIIKNTVVPEEFEKLRAEMLAQF